MDRRPITLIFPYYMNALMLKRQFEHLTALPEDVRAALHLIVVDDGSPTLGIKNFAVGSPPKKAGLASIQMYRLRKDVRWNWIACRNLAASKASTEWLLMTDIDHLVPEATMRRIQEGPLETRNVYRFSRVDAPDLTPYKPHPNSWLLTRKRFDCIGGYDERFSGLYGTDGEFRDRVTREADAVIILDEPLVRVPREVVADASTTTYLRKQPEDHAGVQKVRKLIAKDPTPLRGSFEWDRLL